MLKPFMGRIIIFDWWGAMDTLRNYHVANGKRLTGIFKTDNVHQSPFIWTRNHWFVIANRDSLRHDFYHFFFDKLFEKGQSLSTRDKQIYAFIKADD